jgi:hypothetical protein
VRVSVEREGTRSGRLCSKVRNQPSSLFAPDFVDGAAAALLMWCELADVPCEVTVQQPHRKNGSTPSNTMYI